MPNMKTLLIIIGIAAWVAVGCAAVVNAYDNHASATASLQAQQKAKATEYTTELQTQLKQAENSSSSLSSAKTDLCSWATTAQADLAKYKVPVTVPSVCTTKPS
jgi:hypothetical protein